MLTLIPSCPSWYRFLQYYYPQVTTMMSKLHLLHLHRDFYDVLRVIFFLLILNKESWGSYVVNRCVKAVASVSIHRGSVAVLGSHCHIPNDHFSQDEEKVALSIRGAVVSSNGTAATLHMDMKEVE